MPNVIASTGGFVVRQYLAVDAADEYFENRLNSDDWVNATYSDKQSALVQSTSAIDNLNFVGVKYQPSQLFEFPRWQPADPFQADGPPWFQAGYPYPNPITVVNIATPPIVPQEILIAVCENAIVLLGGFDFELEIAALSNNSSGFSTVRDTYDRSIAVLHLRSGIASATAWNYIRPWLADTNSFTLSRVN